MHREVSKMATRADILPIDRGWAWIIVVATSFLFGLTAGGFKVQGLILIEVTERFPGSTDANNLWLLTVNFILALGLGPVWTFLMTRTQPRYMVMVGVVLYSLSYLGLAYAPTIPLCFLLYSIPGGMGNGMVIISALLISRPYFEKKKALAVGLISSGAGLGQVILPFIIRGLFDNLDFRSALVLYAGFAIQFLLLASLLRPMSYYEQIFTEELKIIETKASNSMKNDVHVEKLAGIGTSGVSGDSNGTLGVSMKDNDIKPFSLLNPEEWMEEPRSRSYSMQHKSFKGDNSQDENFFKSDPGNIHSLVPGKCESKHLFPRPRSRLLTVGSWAGSAVYSREKLENPTEPSNELEDETTPQFFSRELFSNPKLWMLIGSVLTYCLGASIIFQCIPPLAKASGISKETVALILMVGGIIEAPARTLNGYIADRGYMSTLNQYILCDAIAGLCTLMCASVSGLAGTIVGVLGMALTGTSVFSLLPIISEEVMSAKYLNVTVGLLNISQSISFLISTSVAGALYRTFYRWESVIFYIGVCQLIAAAIPVPYALIRTMRDYRLRREDKMSAIKSG